MPHPSWDAYVSEISSMSTPRAIQTKVRQTQPPSRQSPVPKTLPRVGAEVRRIIEAEESDSGGEEASGASVCTPPPHLSVSQIARNKALQTMKMASTQASRGKSPLLRANPVSQSPSRTPKSPGLDSDTLASRQVTPIAMSGLTQKWGEGKIPPSGACTTSRKGFTSESAEEVKQWLRASSAVSTNAAAVRVALAGGDFPGRPQSSVGVLFMQDQWGRFYVAAVAAGRCAH